MSFLKLITKHVSYLFGLFSNLKYPGSRFVVAIFARVLDINLDDAIIPANGFCSINQLFTRELKIGSRPYLRNTNDIISPVDGEIVELGTIENGKLLQVKGKLYTLADLLEDVILSAKYLNGSYITFRLSPKNYHRIHCPKNGKISFNKRIDGSLFPVNLSGRKYIDNLYPKNERVILELESQDESFLIVIVGALLVGSIKINPKIKTQSNNAPFYIRKGDEIGHFEFGSSVVLISDKAKNWSCSKGKINFGEIIRE